MNRNAWYLVGAVAVVAVVTGLLLKKKTSDTDSLANSQSQLPADTAEANYTVPPDIGLSVDNTSGVQYPAGSIYTASQGNSLPTS
jgi:hypothetical protein